MPPAAPRFFFGTLSFEQTAFAALTVLVILALLASRRGGGGPGRRLAGGAALLVAGSGLLLGAREMLPGLDAARLPAPLHATGGDGLYASDGKGFRHPSRLYGADVAQASLQDARAVYGDFLSRARVAELALFPTGESVLAARFDDAADVAVAARAYLQRFRVEMASGDLTQGLRGQRGDLSDRVEILLDGEMLVVWTARTDAALAARRRASEAGGN